MPYHGEVFRYKRGGLGEIDLTLPSSSYKCSGLILAIQQGLEGGDAGPSNDRLDQPEAESPRTA